MVKLVVIFAYIFSLHISSFFNVGVFVLQLNFYFILLISVKFQVPIPWNFGRFSEILLP